MTSIVPKKITEPKQEGWSYSISAADGNYYGVPEKLIGDFRLGVATECEVAVKEKNGKTYRDVARVLQSASPHAQNGAATVAPQYQKQPTPLVDAERMFVAGICNALLPKVYEKEGNMTSEKMVAVIMVARTAWALTFGRKD
jgi:hypothetical protein